MKFNAKMMFKSGAALSGLVLATVLATGSATASQPLTLAQVSDGFDPAATYAQSCAACHNSGAAGAPRMGNAGDWSERLSEKGLDGLTQSTITGIGVMPAKGMCFTCSDEDLGELVKHMLTESGVEF